MKYALLIFLACWLQHSDFVGIERPYAVFTDTLKKPNVVLENAEVDPMNILYISDTVSISELSNVFKSCYAELYAFIKEQGMTPKKTMAFYNGYADPIAVEVAVEVTYMPKELKGRIQSKIIGGGPAIIAHYQGPYTKMYIPYNAITAWIQENKRQAKQLPFEVYLNDPVAVRDSMGLRTDVYQMIYKQ